MSARVGRERRGRCGCGVRKGQERLEGAADGSASVDLTDTDGVPLATRNNKRLASLIDALTHARGADDRLEAAAMLCYTRAPEAAAPLAQAATTDPDPEVRAEATRALERPAE